MNRIIITGANGFIGQYASKRLRAEGCQICPISRTPYRDEDNSDSNIVADLSNCKNLSSIAEKIGNASAMVHLAADITVPGNSVTVGNNISSLLTAIEIARRSGVEHFVYISSVPVIGDIAYTPIDEQHPVKPKTPYHWSKYLGELLLEKYSDAFKTISVIRIPSPIGVGMRANVFLSVLIQRMMRGEDVEIYGKGKRIQNYIDVRDIAEALFLVVKNKSQGLFLIAGKESISNIQLANLCRETIGGSSRIFTGTHDDSCDQERWVISYEKAKKAFGFHPTNTIEDSIKWIYATIADKRY